MVSKGTPFDNQPKQRNAQRGGYTMALINCPECGHEVSDTVQQCPHCGYSINGQPAQAQKKKSKTGLIILIAVLLAACTAACYLFVIQPQQKLSQAETLIARGKFSEAEVILSQLGNSEKKNDLLVQITVAEIEECIKSGDYSGAEKKISTIPEGSVSPELKAELASKQAEAYMIQGKYEEADAMLDSIEQTEDVIKLREELSYESRAFSCIKAIKKVLKNPDSLSIYEINFYPDTVKDTEASTDDNPVYVQTEPSCVMHYGAQNGFGGNTTSYAYFTWGGEEYSLLGAVNSLDEDDLNSNSDDYWYDYLVLLSIQSAMKKEPVGSLNIERVQTLLKNNSYSIIKIIK